MLVSILGIRISQIIYKVTQKYFVYPVMEKLFSIHHAISGDYRRFYVQSTLVISNSKGLSNTSRYQYLDISDLQNFLPVRFSCLGRDQNFTSR